ncbi:MAG: uroporphyrinogen-III synthase [Pseudomonadota bacterium]
MGKRSVLVTRPAGQAEALGQALERAGFSVSYAPLLAIEPFTTLTPQQDALLRSLDRVQHLIFVSQNAIRCALPWIESVWSELPAGLTCYTVGNASAEALAVHGINAATPESDMTSEGLLALPTLRQVAGDRVVIIKGEGGRTRLRDELLERGAQVDELAVYQRVVPDYAPDALATQLTRDAIDCILVSSGEGFDNMMLLLGESGFAQAQALTLVVPGKRVADIARSAGFEAVVVADNATDDAMLSALVQQL